MSPKNAVFFLDLPGREEKDVIWDIYIKYFELDANQRRPDDTNWTGAEIRSCCRLAALLDMPLLHAAENIVPVAATAAESVERLRTWASGRCLSANQPGVYRRDAGNPKSRRRINREPSSTATTKCGPRSAARHRLGELFDASDYPPSLIGMFAIDHDYPSVEPPPYLQQLSPQLYRQECERVRARFDEAVQLAEQTFLEELSRLVDHLAERLSGDTDGKPRIFRDSVVENLTGFFERFRRLNVGSKGQREAN